MPRILFACSLAVVVAASLRAQPDEPTGLTVEVQPKGYVYAFAEDGVFLTDAIAAAAEAAKQPIMYLNQRALEQKKLYVKGEVRVPLEEAWSFWQAIFFAHGHAVVEEPGNAGVLRLEPIDSSRVLKQRADFVAYQDVPALKDQVGRVIMTSIPLQHIQVANVRQAVTQILQNRQAEFTQEVMSANALIVVGFCPTVYAIYQLVRAMDVPFVRMNPEIAAIPLRHAVAAEARNLVMEIVVGASHNAPGRPGMAPAPSMLTVAADVRTNSLVVSGSEETIARVRAIAELVDIDVKGSAVTPPSAAPGKPRTKDRVKRSGSATKEFEEALSMLAKFRKEHGIFDFDAQAAAVQEQVARWEQRHRLAEGVASDWAGPMAVDGIKYSSRKEAVRGALENLKGALSRSAELQELWAKHELLTARLERARARYVRQ